MADPGRKVTSCGICGHPYLTQILDLGAQPMAERGDGHLYPLALLECRQCGLVQLSYQVPQDDLFAAAHPYTTGNTLALRQHFRGLAISLATALEPGDLVVDIGANDGTFLAALIRQRPDVTVLAIEPTQQADKCDARGVPVIEDFWTSGLARRLVKSHGAARFITATNVLAHVPDPHDFMTGVSELLDPGSGQFITENHDWASVVNGLQIDTVYHEHLRYYSFATLGYLLSMHGYLISDVQQVATHGGSFRVTAAPQRRGLAHRADVARDQLRLLLQRVAQDGLIFGIGAATRATPLIHYAGLDEYLACVCEVPGSDKIGQTMPGTTIPIVDESQLIGTQPPWALIFPWHLADQLVPVLRRKGYRGQFIVPLPRPVVLDD